MVCKETSLNKVVNAGQNEGLEAWRQLCLLFEPRIRARPGQATYIRRRRRRRRTDAERARAGEGSYVIG
eukprot:954552-Karenia_brevis.AAC.1